MSSSPNPSKKIGPLSPEPVSTPMRLLAPQPDAPRPEPRRFPTWLGLLLFLGFAAGTLYYFGAIDKIMGAVGPKSAKAAPVQATTRTLAIQPGLLVTFDGAEAIRFTAARVYTGGREVPCMCGWLGVTGGNVSARLDTTPGANPFQDSCVRLRFVAAGSGPKALSVSSDEGNPNLHELEKSDTVAELIYRGGHVKAGITAEHGRLRLTAAPTN